MALLQLTCFFLLAHLWKTPWVLSHGGSLGLGLGDLHGTGGLLLLALRGRLGFHGLGAILGLFGWQVHPPPTTLWVAGVPWLVAHGTPLDLPKLP